MRHVKLFLFSIMISFLITAGVAVITIVVMMFSVHTDSAHLTGLFGAVYFQSSPNESGNIVASAGINSVPRIAAIWVVVCAICLMASYAFAALKRYRGRLIEQKQ